MRKTSALITALLCVFVAQGQSVREHFLAVPDTLLPYLDKGKLVEMIDLYDIKRNAVNDSLMDASVNNRLGGTSVIDTLTADYLRLRLNSHATWEMKLLPSGEPADSASQIIATSLTVKGDKPESKVSLYTTDWKLLSDTIFTSKSLLEKPEMMSDEEFQAKLEQISLVLWSANFSPDDNDLMLTPSLLFVPYDKKEEFLPLKMQRKLKLCNDKFK